MTLKLNSKPEKRAFRIQVYITAEQGEAVQHVAEGLGLGLAELGRVALEHYLEHEPKAAKLLRAFERG